MRMRKRTDTGAATLVETVLIAPALLIALMLIVQFGLMFHARNVAENAAQEGVAAARHYDGTEAGARAATDQYLQALGSKTLTNRQVYPHRTPQVASVTVTGTVITLVPGIHLEVSETASGPVERYVPPVPGNGP